MGLYFNIMISFKKIIIDYHYADSLNNEKLKLCDVLLVGT